MKKISRFIACLIIVCLAMPLVAEGTPVNAKDCARRVVMSSQTDGKAGIAVTEKSNSSKKIISGASDFAVNLFKQVISEEGDWAENKNIMISPTSVLCALAMTANGAKGKTLKQMKNVLGMSVSELNEFVHSYMQSLSSDEKCKLNIANSIWIRDDKDFSVKKGFLQTNEKYYSAEINKTVFDNAAKKKINDWVNDKTDGMIKEIIDEIQRDTMMYLINAICFDAEWQTVYTKEQIRNGMFTNSDGKGKNVTFMHSEEHQYISDENAIGLVKNYSNAKYGFAALLPDEDMSVLDYAATLNGEKLQKILGGQTSRTIIAAIPKFSFDYTASLNDSLKAMGMDRAFSERLANFSRLGTSKTGNIYIDKVIHKTFIEVDELGTRAGAVTAIAMNRATSVKQDIISITFDRPFLYVIFDTENNMPIFMGVVNQL